MRGFLATIRRQAMRAEPSLTVDATGFSIQDGATTHRLDWSEVRRIWTCKADLFIVDSIGLRFELTDGTTTMVAEAIDGFRELFPVLEQRFGISADWWCDVAFPAFATNEKDLWARPDSDQRDANRES
jgi:hypothetical protein